MRRKELASLKWEDIDFTAETVRVLQKGHTEKLLPIPPWYLQLLRQFQEKYGKPSRFIFHPLTNNRGKNLDKPISPSYIFEMVRKAATKLFPDKNITPHSFRASFVTVALENGEDPISIMNATAHSNVQMIRYYDRRNELKSNAIHAMGKRFGEK